MNIKNSDVPLYYCLGILQLRTSFIFTKYLNNYLHEINKIIKHQMTLSMKSNLFFYCKLYDSNNEPIMITIN